MTVFVVGLNHRTAPVDIRECLHVSGEDHLDLLASLQTSLGLAECVIVSTCNRMEVYGVASNITRIEQAIAPYLERFRGLEVGSLAPHLYVHEDSSAATHLMRVASGLDSMVLGEAQILGQVSSAHRLALLAQTSGALLNRLFERAVHTGKRTHNETEIGEHTVSISHAAVLLALSTLNMPTTDINALVVGAGSMASLAVDALRSKHISNIGIANRTPSHAQALAERAEGRAFGWHELHQALAWADIVISATSAPHTVIHQQDMQVVQSIRGSAPQILIDTAVPRDIADNVGEIPIVTFYNIDDLQRVVDENYARRQSAVPVVECIIADEVNDYMAWLRGRDVVPAIKDLREKINEIAQAEMNMALQQLPEDSHAVVSRLVHRIVNKVLHEPTVRLREQANGSTSDEFVYTVRSLFALDGSEEEQHA